MNILNRNYEKEMKFKGIDMEGKCWFCRHFYEKCDDCIDKSKWELW